MQINLENLTYILFFSLMLISVIFIISAIVFFINGVKLNNYLKKNNHAKWAELTTLGSMGPGMSNPAKGFKYIWSDSDNDDEWEKQHKLTSRKGLRWLGTLLVLLIINIVVLFLVGYMASQA